MGVSKVCKAAGMSRQNHYKQRRRREALEVEEASVVELVDEVRRTHPRMGVRKILGLVDKPLEEKGISMGRDRMFDLLRAGLASLPGCTGPSTSYPVVSCAQPPATRWDASGILLRVDLRFDSWSAPSRRDLSL